MHLRSALALVTSAFVAATPAVMLAAPAPALAAGAGSAWRFETQPHLQPPQLKVSTDTGRLGSGLIFTAPFKNANVASPEVGQPGALLMDTRGNPVWFQPAPGSTSDEDFKPQTLQGKPVLTFWQGVIALPNAANKAGLPEGTPEPGARYEILNQHYQLIKTIRAQDGWTADLHEFTITPQGNALFLVTRIVKANLTAEGGAASGEYEDNGIQEVDLKTGKVQFTWDIAHAVPLSQSSSGIWDPYHLNSVSAAANDTLLVSARNAWSLYDISPTASGSTIDWTLDAKPGATDSTYTLGAGAAFSWQHDAEMLPDGDITLFDDSCCGAQKLTKPLPSASGEVLSLDASTKTASVLHRYYHSPALVVPAQGNLQTLSAGNVLIDWGQAPVFSAYTAAGKLIYAAGLPAADSTYRAYLKPWVGLPLTRPSIKVTTKGSATTVYVSWDGATRVTKWELLAGTGTRLKPLGTVARAGFETAIHLKNAGTLNFRITAIGAGGTPLGSSAIARG
jgi:hypothetical protein